MIPFDAARCQRSLLTQRFGRSMQALGVTDSTMDDARAAAEQGAEEGHVVVADAQRSGRGSHGRPWSSPPGSDLYFSLVLRPALSLSDLPPLTLAVGLAVAETLDATLVPLATTAEPARGAATRADAVPPGTPSPARARIKWPNDVYVDGKKCAGVLVETRSVGATPAIVVVGIGVNVNRRSFEPALASESTSLALATGADVDREALLAQLLGALERQWQRFVAHGPAAITRDVEARLLFRGEPVCVDDAAVGILSGVDPDGALRVEDGGALRRVLSGRLRRAPSSG